ncbi:MAG: outer membrane beta-barrel protein [Acidobacteriaceae bacterium]
MAVLLSNVQINAQALGGLTGTVTDPTGAGIPGARVTFKNGATGVVMQVGTTSTGTYAATALASGQYSLTVEAPGFKKYVETSVVVEIGVTPTINIQMAIGAADQNVLVVSNSIALNTTQAQVGTSLEPKLVSALPLEINSNIRQINQFASLVPGVTPGRGFNGGIKLENGIAFNGIPITQPYAQGFQTNMNPPFEMVNEFRALTSTFSAKYGLAQGVLTFNMRSGTNHLHGDGFYIDRNSAFDSVGFFPTNFSSSGKPIPPVDQESDFGGTISGPVILPNLYNGKNRTFFLGSADLFYKDLAETAIGSVPTPAMKNGDFSNFVNAAGKQIPIYDPTTGKPFPGNIIPASRINPLSKAILPLIPNPNSTGTIYGLQNNKTPAVASVPVIRNVWGFTLDHNISQSQSIHFSEWRNSESQSNFTKAPIVPTTNELQSGMHGIESGNALLLNYVNTVTQNLVATAGISWVEQADGQYNALTNVNFAGVQSGTIFPGVTFDGQNADTAWGVDSGWTQDVNRTLGIAIVNNWLWTKGRHTFNFGGEFRRGYQDSNSCGQCGGAFHFSHATTSTPNPSDPNFTKYGSSFASFLLGEVDSASRVLANELKLRNLDFSPYIQDNIKVNSKLTVNIGLRWDIMVPFTENNNQIFFMNKTASNPGAGNLPGATTMFGNCSGCAGYDRAAIHWGNFGPRLGFAYSLNDKTVIQGGAFITYLNGGAYEMGSSRVAQTMGNLADGEFNQIATKSNIPGYGDWASRQMPLPPPVPFNPSMANGHSIYYFNSNSGLAPYDEAWSLNLQRQLPWNMFLNVAYVGNRAVHLPSGMNPINQPDPSILQYGSLLTQNINSPAAKKAGIKDPYPAFSSDFGSGATVFQALRPYPQYTSVGQDYDMSGTTFYNAMQVQAQKRFSNGLSYLASLSLPRLMANTDTGQGLYNQGPLNKYNQKAEYVVTDESYNIKTAATYILPIGVEQKYLNSGVLAKVFGGWQVAGIFDYSSVGGVMGVTESGSGINGFDRPDVVPGVKMKTYNYNLVKDYFVGKLSAPPVMFTTNAFVPTANQFVLGNAVRKYTALRGPPPGLSANLDAMKFFNITDTVRVTMRMDYFNAFNHHVFGAPITDISSPNFGESLSENGGGNRQGQLTLRVSF